MYWHESHGGGGAVVVDGGIVGGRVVGVCVGGIVGVIVVGCGVLVNCADVPLLLERPMAKINT